jgi:hypothetical protein
VEHGQSGSPVFVARRIDTDSGPQVSFILIGLLHAREKGTSYMVPTTLWQHALNLHDAPAEAVGTLAEAEIR